MTAPSKWYPVAGLLAAVNLLGLGYAVATGEPMHAIAHAVLVVAFGAWAHRLGGGRSSSGRIEQQDRIDALEDQMSNMQGELTDAQDRLDFAERMLAQEREFRRVNPEN